MVRGKNNGITGRNLANGKWGKKEPIRDEFYSFFFQAVKFTGMTWSLEKNTQSGIFVVANDFSKLAINCLNIHNSQQLKGNKGTDFLIIMV